MDNFTEYLEARITALKKESEELEKTDRKDEAVLDKVRANIYEVCGTVCKVHMNRPGGGPDACRAQFEKFRAQWSSAMEKAEAFGATDKAAVEKTKLKVLADVARHFEEMTK